MRTALIFSIALQLTACEPSKQAKAPTSEGESGKWQVLVEDAVGIGDPEIEFQNPTNRAVTVEMRGPAESKLEIPPMQARSVKVAGGEYKVRVLGADLTEDVPFAFDADHRYRIVLKFFLEIDDPRYAGKGLECVPLTSTITYYACGRTAEACELYRGRAPTGTKVGACAHAKSMFGFRANEGDGVAIPFAPTTSDCEAIRAAWLKGHPGGTASACELVE